MKPQKPWMLSGEVAGRAVSTECMAFEQATCDRNIEFQNLIARELPRFQRMAMRCLRNREDAEDAVQDAVLSAFTHMASFQGRARMSTWLTSIVINSARMHFRRGRRDLPPFDPALQGESRVDTEILRDRRPNPEQSCQYLELCGIITDSMNHLPKAQRAAFELYSLKGLSLKEVSKVLGIPVGTLKSHLARGRTRLRRKIWRSAAPSSARRLRLVTNGPTCSL